jgi:subtilisin family serine protease
MHARARALVGFATLAIVAACKEQTPIPHTPVYLKVVSGSNQSANVSTALDSALVVQVLDAANRGVSGVNLTWTASGGTLSAATSTTDNDGKSSVKWTLAPTAGTQVVTVTSTQVTGAAATFVANNGAVISGTVAALGSNPFGATFSRSARPVRYGVQRQVAKHPSADRIIVGFRDAALGVPAAGSGAYRSLSVARTTRDRMLERVAAISRAHPVVDAEVSPAILAARMRVTDTLDIERVITELRADPSIAYVSRDQIISIRDGAPRPMSANFIPALETSGSTSIASRFAATTKLPNDPAFFEQAWPANMLDLPRAWNVTTGSSTVTVAVVDMGIRFDHPEVAANLTQDGYDFVSQIGFGTTETKCDGTTFTTIDGDGDGPDPDPTDPDDLEFDFNRECWAHSSLGDHGLWTAGIIGAVGNDLVGMAGVAWNVKIRPIRVLGMTGDGSTFDIAQGILYAAGLPAKGANNATVTAPSRAPIINLSLGGDFDATMDAAVQAASNAGSLVVASAGNDGLDIPVYPAASRNAMAVAAVGMDGGLATYSNAGTFISVSAPGGDFRLDDNGGGGIFGPGWNFNTNRATYLFGYGTSASAPYVSGIAALLLAQTPTLTANQLRTRIENFATRGNGLSRSDVFGWGIANAYSALTQQNGPTRSTIVRLVDATTGIAGRTAAVDANGNFVFTKVQTGTYFLQAGDDEAGDGQIGVAGRRFTWAGGFGKPTVFNVNGNTSTAAIALGIPLEVEPNDDIAHANLLSVNSYVVGSITTPDTRDVYSVTIPVPGTYTFETSGLVGSCGLGIELDTFMQVTTSAGTNVGTSDNPGRTVSPTGPFCSRVQASLQSGIYYITISGSFSSGLADHGRYRLEVRSGT